MKPTFRRLARDWLPPVVLRALQRLRAPQAFSGDYGSWAEAAAASGGYDAPAIFAAALDAARAVRDGQAAFERDTVRFAVPADHAPLLGALLRAAAAGGGRLRVIDFGGAFGSAWWQHRQWLDGIPGLQWNVVEQPHFVAAGRREFEVGPLRFHASLADGVRDGPADVVLLSSVLPYLEQPHALLAEVARGGPRYVIIDRTGFVPRGRDRLTVQRVPPAIYAASYPCWFFDRAALLRPFSPGYRVVAEWPSFDVADIAAEFRGLLLERASP